MNAHIEKAEWVYFTGGIWGQAGREFDFNGTVDNTGIVALFKKVFTGTATSKQKILLCAGGCGGICERLRP